ncbi:hypothetical protein [Streptomyces sp. NPDC057253]
MSAGTPVVRLYGVIEALERGGSDRRTGSVRKGVALARVGAPSPSA